MKRLKNAGFTMIELIVVIVILGILAATALPKFVDISGDAKSAALQGVAGALGSASAVNYAGCLVTNNVVTPNKCIKVNACASTGGTNGIGALLQGGLPNGYTVAVTTAGSDITTANGNAASCTVSLSGYTPSTPVTFTGMSAGN